MQNAAFLSSTPEDVLVYTPNFENHSMQGGGLGLNIPDEAHKKVPSGMNNGRCIPFQRETSCSHFT